MWPVCDQSVKEDDGTAHRDTVEAVDDVPADMPADAEEQIPEEAGYGYGV
jgi:hypothetical protein